MNFSVTSIYESYNPPSLPPPIPFATRPQWPVVQTATGDASASHISHANAVYYPNWRVYRGETPATLNLKCISHVFYAFAQVNSNGSVTLNDEWADTQMPVDGASGCLGSFVCLKKQYSHLKLILSIGGGSASQNFAPVASNAVTRDNFARSARHLVDTVAFDGIDIDWEHPSDSDQGRDFIALLAAIRLRLPMPRYLLTAALPAGEWALQNIDLFRANNYLDILNIMAYDFTGSWSSKSGHHAQLYPRTADECSGTSAVDYILSKGFPSTKLLLGIPLYGRSFLGATGIGKRYKGVGGEEGTFEYKQLPRPNCQETTDIRAVAASCIGGDGGFVSYDNPDTVRMKVDYCKRKGLAGLFYWSGTADAAPGPRSLITTGFNSLHGY